MAENPILGLDFTLHSSWSHSDTANSVRFMWTSDQTDAETSTWQHAALEKHKILCPGWYSKQQLQQARGRRHTS